MRFPSNGAGDQGRLATFQGRVLALGLSVADLARRSGMLKKNVAKIVAGESPMTRGLEQVVEKLERERG
mgnify:CR=1 FL=1